MKHQFSFSKIMKYLFFLVFLNLLIMGLTLDNGKLKNDFEKIIPPSANSFFSAQSITLQEADSFEEVTVDIMVVYTEDAYNYAFNNLGGIDSAITRHMENAQLALDNSAVFVNLNLVHSQMVEYEETGNSFTDLVRLTYLKNDTDHPYDCMDDIHEWRDAYGADLTVLLVDNCDVRGRGWQLLNEEGDPDHGFSLTQVAAFNYVFLHEIGHNMGLGHDVQYWNTDSRGLHARETDGYNSAGWRWDGNDTNKYSTVMSYGDQSGDIRVPYISNPDISYAGAPTGHETFGNNSRTMRLTKHVVAAYRDPPLLPPELPGIISNDIISNIVTVSYEDDPAWRSNITRIYIDGKALDKKDYTVGEGKITFNLSIFQIAGSYELKIAAKGFSYAESILEISAGAVIFQYVLPGQTGYTEIDTEKASIKIKYPAGMDLNELKADFIISPGATACVDETEQISGETSNDFSLPVVYRIISAGEDVRQWTVIVEVTENALLSDLKIGDRVVDKSWNWEYRTGSGYGGDGELKPVTWIVASENHYGAESGITLITEEVIGLYTFDNSTNVTFLGSNHWGDSGKDQSASYGIRPWLNGSGKFENNGFYSAFSSGFKDAVLTVTVPNIRTGESDLYYTEDKVIIPSLKELGFSENDDFGAVFSYFDGIGNPDRVASLAGNNYWYWTRSPLLINTYMVFFVDHTGARGTSGDNLANFSGGGVRPVVNLIPDLKINAVPDEGYFELLTSDNDDKNGDGIIYYGDTDGDGNINVGDAILVLRHIVGLIQLDEEAIIRAKVSESDGGLNVGDAILILRRIVGLIESFPVENI